MTIHFHAQAGNLDFIASSFDRAWSVVMVRNSYRASSSTNAASPARLVLGPAALTPCMCMAALSFQALSVALASAGLFGLVPSYWAIFSAHFAATSASLSATCAFLTSSTRRRTSRSFGSAHEPCADLYLIPEK